jgi:hypothetical protein
VSPEKPSNLIRAVNHLALCLLFGFVFVSGTAIAQPSAPSVSVDRPNAGGPADVIRVDVLVLDIADVRNADQLFTIDAYLVLQWNDPRLANDSVNSERERIRSVSLDSIWQPGLLVVNGRGLDTRLPWRASLDDAGNVTVRQRVSGPMAVDLNLREFPFDTQRLPFELVSYLHTPDEVVFSPESQLFARVDSFRAEGWSFTPDDVERSVFRVEESGAGAPAITFALVADRNAAFFVLTLAMPLTLVVLLSWIVHWIPPGLVPPRIGMASASVFSLVALSVTFRLTLPQIDYLTRVDQFVMASTFLVAVSLCISVACARFVHQDRESVAFRLARWARVLIPAAYLLVIAFIVGV